MASQFEPQSFLARLKEAFGGISIEVVAGRLGVKRQAVYKWGRGETHPDLDRLLQISELTGVSLHWLLTGEGPKIVESAENLERLRDEIEERKLEVIKNYLTKQLISLSNRDKKKAE
ncbi:MAG TPA: helix-turn-helix domain-containing protein [Blastocatellia bacterium]|nr:helix-turn-helix domain-containing protein [Blastocatellia bacterium]